MENLSEDWPVMLQSYQAVVVGVSAGGLKALKVLLSVIPADFSMPVIIVQHLHPQQDRYYIQGLDELCALPVREAEEKEIIGPGTVYFAPPNYHLLIEEDKTFSLSVDEKVNYSRPSIDVLFETAAEAFREGLIGIILTGANKDGAAGLRKVKEHGGFVLVQDPETAEFPVMPLAALDEVQADYVLHIEEIGHLISKMGQMPAALDS